MLKFDHVPANPGEVHFTNSVLKEFSNPSIAIFYTVGSQIGSVLMNNVEPPTLERAIEVIEPEVSQRGLEAWQKNALYGGIKLGVYREVLA